MTEYLKINAYPQLPVYEDIPHLAANRLTSRERALIFFFGDVIVKVNISHIYKKED